MWDGCNIKIYGELDEICGLLALLQPPTPSTNVASTATAMPVVTVAATMTTTAATTMTALAAAGGSDGGSSGSGSGSASGSGCSCSGSTSHFRDELWYMLDWRFHDWYGDLVVRVHHKRSIYIYIYIYIFVVFFSWGQSVRLARTSGAWFARCGCPNR